MQEFTVRGVRQDDLESIAEIEAVCFPAEEAASRDSFKGGFNLQVQHPQS